MATEGAACIAVQTVAVNEEHEENSNVHEDSLIRHAYSLLESCS